jgi:hypothetical protein
MKVSLIAIAPLVLVLNIFAASPYWRPDQFAPVSAVDATHPYRKIGTNYVSLGNRFAWVHTYRTKLQETNLKQTGNFNIKSQQKELALARLMGSKPNKEWSRVQSTVLEVNADRTFLIGTNNAHALVTNYPVNAAVGEFLDFHGIVYAGGSICSMESSDLRSWRGFSRHAPGEPAWVVDFGIPYDPLALKALKEKGTNTVPVKR